MGHPMYKFGNGRVNSANDWNINVGERKKS